MDTDRVLENLAPLAGGDTVLLRDLKAAARIREFEPKQFVVEREATDTDVFCMLEGHARILVYSEDGHEIWIDDLTPGDIFGEMAALRAIPRSADVQAVSRTVVAVFSERDFVSLMNNHGRLGIELSRRLIDRLHHTTRRLYELSALSAPGRIYAELLRSARFEGCERELGVIRPIPTLAELARRVNSTRETASRTVTDLEQRGLVIRKHDHMIVLAPRQLGRPWMGGGSVHAGD